jgi:hypothetical protein
VNAAPQQNKEINICAEDREKAINCNCENKIEIERKV